MDNKIDKLIEALQQGYATEQDKGAALKNISTFMSMSMISSLSKVSTNFEKLSNVLDAYITRFTTDYSTNLQANNVTTDDLFEKINSIQTRQIQLLDLYRKIIQSPQPLFPENTISEDEKNVLKLFKSFKTPEQKLKFLELCERELNLTDGSN